MNDIEKLKEEINNRGNELGMTIITHIDPPLEPTGIFFLDVRTKPSYFVVTWKQGVSGFGLTSVRPGEIVDYGSKPDKILPDMDAVIKEIFG